MAPNKARLYALTGAVAAITATGTWYGAGLKTRQEIKQERQTALEASTDDQIVELELKKTRLLRQRAELQSKIDRLAGKPSESAVESKVQGR